MRVYHEIIAISNCYDEITQRKENELHHELYGNTFSEINSAINIIKLRGNPYNPPMQMSSQLHNFCTGQVVKVEARSRFLLFENNSIQRYNSSRRQCFITKEVKLGETIKNANLPTFKSTSTSKVYANITATVMKKKIGQREIDIARSRSVSMKTILECDHIEQSLIFEDILTKKPDKSSLVKSLEGYLDKADYDYCKSKDITNMCYSRLYVHDQKDFIQ